MEGTGHDGGKGVGNGTGFIERGADRNERGGSRRNNRGRGRRNGMARRGSRKFNERWNDNRRGDNGGFRGQQRDGRAVDYGPEINQNFPDGMADFNHSGNNQEQNRNAEICFPKFKDDSTNIFNNKRTNFDNIHSRIPPLLGYYEFPQNSQTNVFDYKSNVHHSSPSASGKQIGIDTEKKNLEEHDKLVTNIKKEHIEEIKKSTVENTAKKPKKKPVASSSSSDSDSDSDANSTIKKLLKTTKNKSKNTKESTTSLVPKPKIKKEPDLKESKKSSSSESSSSSEENSSTTENNSPKGKIKKKKKHIEEEVICLGKLENIENLVDDEETTTGSPKKSNFCLLCDKKGHLSFHCQMICKNCGAQYHNLKNCPKPANLSIMLQNFLEFCLNQCTIYNPDQRFTFRNGNVQTELLPAAVPPSIFSTSNDFFVPPKSKKLRNSDIFNSSKISGSSKNRNKSDSEEENATDSSSSEATTSTKRKRKRSKLQSTQNNVLPYPGNIGGFSSPFAFNPMMAAFNQMMGFNPAAAAALNFATNTSK